MPEKLKYSIIMFIAGCGYGIMVPLVRTAYNSGYDTPDVLVTQYLIAALALALVSLIFSRKKVSPKDALKLMGVGVVAAGVSFFYYQALKLLSPAASLTLLFQFVWMGMVVQAVRTRSLPRTQHVVAVILVIIGAVFATGMLDDGFSVAELDPLGIIFGLLSAVCYTAFLTLSGLVATSLPTINRTLFTTTGSFVISFAIAPTYFVAEPMIVLDPVLGLTLGIAGICIPVFLINLSSPKLPTGLTSIMASSELPSGVICAAIFIGEPITLTVGIGVVIVLVGVVVSELDTILGLIRKSGGDGTQKPEPRA